MNNHISSKDKLLEQASQYIGVRRLPELYQVYELDTEKPLAACRIDTEANDMITTHLRDNLVKAYYVYGKSLGRYQ